MAERMKWWEVVEEFEWLIGGGVHPNVAAQQLGRNPETLARMFHRYGRLDLARMLERKWEAA